MAGFLETLLISSEKAANIARACRSEKELFPLLIQEKSSEEANSRFAHDFKTVADVLIQETVRFYVTEQYPKLKNNIFGEENNEFITQNEKVVIEVKNSCPETAKLLFSIFDDINAANILAKEVHKCVDLKEVNTNKDLIPHIDNVSNFGVWIDPIDSTAEYINGKNGKIEDNNICKKGLQCVTVLIGVFNTESGKPIMGIVNQPFYEMDSEGKWIGKCHWSICTNNISVTSLHKKPSTKIIILSTVEDSHIKSRLSEYGFTLVEAAGAGYKILMVANGHADAYVLSKSTCFKWDTCGPHALLRSLEGGIVEFKTALKGNIKEITYSNKNETDNKCNTEGIIAYKNRDILDEIIRVLK